MTVLPLIDRFLINSADNDESPPLVSRTVCQLPFLSDAWRLKVLTTKCRKTHQLRP